MIDLTTYEGRKVVFELMCSEIMFDIPNQKNKEVEVDEILRNNAAWNHFVESHKEQAESEIYSYFCVRVLKECNLYYYCKENRLTPKDMEEDIWFL